MLQNFLLYICMSTVGSLYRVWGVFPEDVVHVGAGHNLWKPTEYGERFRKM